MRWGREAMAPILLSLVTAAVLLGWRADAQAQEISDEAHVKAAFLVRFGQFIEWPAEAFKATDGAFVIGVIGSKPVLKSLQRLAKSRAAHGHAVRAHAITTPDGLPHMRILFVGASEKARMPQHVASVAGRPVLVVGEWDEAIQQGAAINFILVKRRVRFEIALDAAQKAGLVVSSRLLSIAARVYRGGLRPESLLTHASSYPAPECVYPPWGAPAHRNLKLDGDISLAGFEFGTPLVRAVRRQVAQPELCAAAGPRLRALGRDAVRDRTEDTFDY